MRKASCRRLAVLSVGLLVLSVAAVLTVGSPRVHAASQTKQVSPADAATQGGKNKTPDNKDTKAQSGSEQEQGEKPAAGADKQAQRDEQTLPKGNASMAQLLRLWSVFGSDVHDSCSNFNVGNLHCLTDTSNFSTIEHYNRPVLLVLKTKGHTQKVLLSVINKDDTLTLVGGTNARNVARNRVLSLWTGRYIMIWRCASGAKMIYPGSVGSPVIWLRQRLLLAQSKKSGSKLKPGWLSPVYDQELLEHVKAFQKTHDLRPDGIVGPRTQIVLNEIAPSPGTPDLNPKKPSSSTSSPSNAEEKK